MSGIDTTLYLVTRRVGDIFHQCVDKVRVLGQPTPWYTDLRNSAVIRNTPQTAEGLCLRFSGGIPVSVLTQWGEWRFAGWGNCDDNQLAELLWTVEEYFVLEDFQDECLRLNGDVDSFTCQLLEVEGIVLPPPFLRLESAMLSYDDAERAWLELTNRLAPI